MKICILFIFIILLTSIMFEGFGRIQLLVQDTRWTATTSNSYTRSFEFHLKHVTSIDLDGTGSNVYYTILGLRG